MKDVEINAIGRFEPGEYGTVEVNGVASCPGAVTARSLEVNGVLKCGGAVRCDRGEINGTLSCHGRLDAGEMEINGAVTVKGTAGIETLEVDGALTVEGDLLECGDVECDGGVSAKGDIKARSLEIDGSLTAQRDITAEEIEVDGSLKVGGNVAADKVTVDGALRAEGQVSADHVHIEGVISAAEVVGDQVVIWNGDRGWKEFQGEGWSVRGKGVQGSITIQVGGKTIEIGGGSGLELQTSVSQVGLIEATTIALKDVTCDTVNGTDVTIGPGCVIGHLDCNGILRIDPAARVESVTGEYTMEDE